MSLGVDSHEDTATPHALGPYIQPTIESTWLEAIGQSVDDDLVHWPPDVFALTQTILDRAEVYRFAVSPPAGREWPPAPAEEWDAVLTGEARQWSRCGDYGCSELPDLVARDWKTIREASATTLDELASGRPWRACTALLRLHAIADEACAGVGGKIGPGDPTGISFRARARERLARSGSMARIDPARLRVLPKYRTPAVGITSGSISRYVGVVGPSGGFALRTIPGPSAARHDGLLNLLLLPWPLWVEDKDFRPLTGSIRERVVEPYGYFEYRPSEAVDVELVDQLLAAARRETPHIDIVILPEGSVSEATLGQLELVLAKHGVNMLIAGVRSHAESTSAFGSNWVHVGSSLAGRWSHVRQDKRHRWSMERSQIEQYHLEKVLDPRVRWWEAIEVRPRSLQLIERGDGHTIASLVCEDLARVDEITNLLRSVGPNLIVSLLLDGPQLTSRWTARYASMLVDDPGSAVLTLSSYGMVQRAWSDAHGRSSIVALWNDGVGGAQQIALEAGAQGILLTADGRSSLRRAADGRSPTDNAIELSLVRVTQLRATTTSSPSPNVPDMERQQASLNPTELTVLLAWARAVAEAIDMSSAQLDAILADARAGAAWRYQQNLPEPTGPLSHALKSLAFIATRFRTKPEEFRVDRDEMTEDIRPEEDEAAMRLASAALSSMVGLDAGAQVASV